MKQQDNYPVANLHNNQLEKIQDLEQQLNQGTDEKIILVAYHQEESN